MVTPLAPQQLAGILPRQAVHMVQDALQAAGCPDADYDARELLRIAAGKDPRLLFDPLTRPQAECLAELAAQRMQRVPLQYLAGEWDFLGLTFKVGPGVLCPRADSEVVCETAIELLQQMGKPEPRVLDLCAGSGCIGLALAKNAPESHVVLGELDEGALRICRQNIRRNDLTGRVVSLQLDAREKPPAHLGEFDCIVSNPPYIPDGDIAELDASVRDYEPHLALRGGADGLDFYRAIAGHWTAALRVGGRLLFEVGIGQADEVLRTMRSVGFGDLEITPDLNGIPRVVEGVLCSEL